MAGLHEIRDSVFRLIAETQLEDTALPIGRLTEEWISTLRQLSISREAHTTVSTFYHQCSTISIFLTI
jgi:hypothetical protein